MAERRQAHRREPIEVEVRDRVFTARPLPWLKRNDLGNEIMTQYTELLNSSLAAYKNPETGTPELSLYLQDKVQRPVDIIMLGYPDEDKDWINELDYPELLELIFASLDVNQLETLRDLVDPNSQPPTNPGGTSSPGEETSDTPSPQPILDSSSQDSLEKPS